MPADGWRRRLQEWIDNPSSTRPDPCTCIVFGLLIIGFAYFYTAITFDPVKQADTIRKQGGFIPGIRPGPQTERYLGQDPQPHHAAGCAVHRRDRDHAFHRPDHCCGQRDGSIVSLRRHLVLIAVGVALETMKQIDSQLTMRNYEGFLK